MYLVVHFSRSVAHASRPLLLGVHFGLHFVARNGKPVAHIETNIYICTHICISLSVCLSRSLSLDEYTYIYTYIYIYIYDL